MTGAAPRSAGLGTLRLELASLPGSGLLLEAGLGLVEWLHCLALIGTAAGIVAFAVADSSLLVAHLLC